MVVCWEIVGRGLYVSFCLCLLSLCVPGKIAGLTSQSHENRSNKSDNTLHIHRKHHSLEIYNHAGLETEFTRTKGTMLRHRADGRKA